MTKFQMSQQESSELLNFENSSLSFDKLRMVNKVEPFRISIFEVRIFRLRTLFGSPSHAGLGGRNCKGRGKNYQVGGAQTAEDKEQKVEDGFDRRGFLTPS